MPFDFEQTVAWRCEGCGDPIPPSSTRTRCKPSCGRTSQQANAARAKKRDEHIPRFIAVDGEGVKWCLTHNQEQPRCGCTGKVEHRYVLLSVGDRSFHRNGAHLQFTEIMEFLYSCFEADGVFVGYYLSYDFAQWMRTLPEERARMLMSPGRRQRTRSGGNPMPFPVRYQGWEFDTLGMRRWRLRPDPGEALFDDGVEPSPWMYICDCGPFFQMPFVRASDPKDWHDKNGPIHIATPEELEIIERGKKRRDSAILDDEMIAYNQAENRVLQRMMTAMAGGFRQMGVSLNKMQWFGPGQVAGAWMKQHNTHTSEAVMQAVPPGALQMAQETFFGGWFEITRHGHVPGITHEYDIGSAYPAIHSTLPCLLHGRWTNGRGISSIPDAGWTMFRGTVSGSDDYLGAAMHRTKNGRVLRPRNTSGAFWLHEIQTAIGAGLIDQMQVNEWWNYQPCDCPPPMRDLAKLFDLRVEVGKQTPAGRGYRLNYNSAYGKCAQSVGNPQFANPVHASMITCGCRVMILEGIASHPRMSAAVVMIATDGLYLDEEHPYLDMGAGLGQWEYKQKKNLTLVMPGMYWDDATRELRNPAKLKSRGVNADALLAMINDFDDQFTKMVPWLTPWPSVDTYMKFAMITPAQAIQRNDWSLCGTVLTNYKKTLSSDPKNKRAPPKVSHVQSSPYTMGKDDQASKPYTGTFGMYLDTMRDDHIADDGLTMDASIASIVLR